MGLFLQFGDLFERVLEAFWGVLGASEAVWRQCWASWVTFGRIKSFLVAFCKPQGRTWVVLGASSAVLGLSWAVLGPSGAPLRLSWGGLGSL